jgi:pilus assembly protein CpaC
MRTRLARYCVGGIAVALVAAAPPIARAATPPGSVVEVSVDAAGYGGQLALPTGGSRVLHFAQPIGRVMLGDPKVADVVPLSDHSIFVVAKAAGSSSLLVMPRREGGAPVAAMDVKVGFDVGSLQRALQLVIPGEAITVGADGDGLVLSGVVSSSAVAAQASQLAARYAPDKVANLLTIRAAEQVMLQVHVAEVKRSALRQLGITSLSALWTDTGKAISLPGLTASAASVAALGGIAKIGNNMQIEGLIEALETKGYATTLAEPTLIALSGETAQFFAGGEFPVPVPQLQGGSGGSSTITIDYKPYGVSVGFTPTVIGDTINLAVAPEVSALDTAHQVNLLGFTVPGITTRRARTTVELRNGQSFAIAGLIQRDFSNSLRGIPGAASLPIFGALFRSTAYQNDETEVVVIVTVHLARPTDRRNLLLPTEASKAATGAQMIFTNTTDTDTQTQAARPASQQEPAR